MLCVKVEGCPKIDLTFLTNLDACVCNAINCIQGTPMCTHTHTHTHTQHKINS